MILFALETSAPSPMQDACGHNAPPDCHFNIYTTGQKHRVTQPTTSSSQDWHLNRTGNEKTMRELADTLMRFGMVK